MIYVQFLPHHSYVVTYFKGKNDTYIKLQKYEHSFDILISLEDHRNRTKYITVKSKEMLWSIFACP